MIEDINLKNSEVSAILTMVFDEIQGIYELEEDNWRHELKRLRGTLITSMFMMDKRVQEINELSTLIIKNEADGGKA